jgi:hypothetical protein
VNFRDSEEGCGVQEWDDLDACRQTVAPLVEQVSQAFTTPEPLQRWLHQQDRGHLLGRHGSEVITAFCVALTGRRWLVSDGEVVLADLLAPAVVVPGWLVRVVQGCDALGRSVTVGDALIVLWREVARAA